MKGIQDEASNPMNKFSSNWRGEHHLGTSSSVHAEDLLTSIFNVESILIHVDGQPKTVLSDVVSINDPIVDSNGGVAAGLPLHPAHLGARSGWVRTPVLSVCNPEVHVVRLDLDALNGLDHIQDVGVVNERAVPDGGVISLRDQRSKDRESYFSFELASSISLNSLKSLFSFLTEDLELLNISDVHVPHCTGVYGECESGRDWTRVLTPANLQPVVVEGQALERSDLVEGHGGSWVDECNKLSKSSLEWS